MHGLPGVAHAARHEVRAFLLHVTEEPRFIIARRRVARRKTSPDYPNPRDPWDGAHAIGGIISKIKLVRGRGPLFVIHSTQTAVEETRWPPIKIAATTSRFVSFDRQSDRIISS
jgi:hypothetical protein